VQVLADDRIICFRLQALGIDTHEHHGGGINKPAIRPKCAAESEARLGTRVSDHDLVRSIRRQIHRLNRQIRAHVAPWHLAEAFTVADFTSHALGHSPG
jgi:hypothetical protein